MAVELLEEQRGILKQLCVQHRVAKLEVYGSGIDPQAFTPGESDFDFLVEFLPLDWGEHADCYFGLLEGLQDLLQHEIDLVMIRAIRNRYFLENIRDKREVLYES